jgi:serine protease Do
MQTPKCVLLLSLAGSLVFLEAFPAHAGTGLDLARQLNQAFIEVAEKVSPSVVVITVTQKAGTFSLEGGTDGDENSTDALPPDFWRRFHRQFQDQMPEKTKDQGSGIIIRKDGYILTNRHVVENAEAIEVRLLDGRTFKAKVRGVDAGSDLAVIKIDADNLPVAKLADSAKTRVGEFAIAIGAPFAYDYSITFGHVSAKGRSNVIPVFSGGATMDQDFIQTDANINPGNSGGPLLNIDGEVIGINTIILGLRSGIGFAIPSNLAREVADKLIADGKFTRASASRFARSTTIRRCANFSRTPGTVSWSKPFSPAALPRTRNCGPAMSSPQSTARPSAQHSSFAMKFAAKPSGNRSHSTCSGPAKL